MFSYYYILCLYGKLMLCYVMNKVFYIFLAVAYENDAVKESLDRLHIEPGASWNGH